MRSTGEERLGTTISVDYCFMVPEERGEELAPILLGYDDQIDMDDEGRPQRANGRQCRMDDWQD